MNSSIPVLRKALIYGAWLALAIAVIGSVVGGLVAGWSGVASALTGTAMAAIFTAITSGSILLASRVSRDMISPAFFGIVLGGWIVKFVLFIVLVFVTRDQPWVQPVVLFLCIVTAVVGSLVVDVVAVTRTRQPYVGDIPLPGAPEHSDSK